MSDIIYDKEGRPYRIEKKIDSSGKKSYSIKAPGHEDAPEGAWNIGNVTLRKEEQSASSVYIDDAFQRKGLATALYDYVEKDLGHPLVPNAVLTEEGAAFWERRAAKAAAQTVSEVISDLPTLGFRFDSEAKAAVKAAEKMAAQMVVEITAETQANIRNLIAEAIRDGIPPYDAARTIVPLIGLTSAQGQAVLKYRKELIDNGLTLEKTNEKVDTYASELLEQRGETIARTEILDALNSGQDEAWSQAQDEGLLSKDATKEVILTEDACDECVEVAEAGPVPVGDDFSEDGPPFHPRCRCTVAISTP